MITAPIHDLDLERYVLSGILRNPESFADIDGYISDADFVNNLHKTVFNIARQTLRQKETLEIALISQKIQNLSLSFDDKIPVIYDYLSELTMIQIPAKSVKDVADELKLVTVRREISQVCSKIQQEMQRANKVPSPEGLLKISDQLYNDKISIWDSGINSPANINDGLEEFLFNRGNSTDMAYNMPHTLTHKMYGSLLRPANISVICARAGAGKTTFITDLSYKASEMNEHCPILHMDAGEMLKEELQLRMIASLSGVPLHFIETGRYKSIPAMLAPVKAAILKIKKIPMHYFNVGGLSTEQILTILKRFYLAKVGRGNKLIFTYDYLKSSAEKANANVQEYQAMGNMVTKFKDCISSEVIIPMLSAVQGNRGGIVTGKSSNDVSDDESIISGGDRIMFYASQVFILRKKTSDEFNAENKQFGSHKFINLKARHLGEDAKRAVELVKLLDGKSRYNYVNMDINNFHVEEKGDLVQMMTRLKPIVLAKKKNEDTSF